MLNKAILMGRLTRDPELRHTQNNTPVASFTLAIDRGRKDANGQSQTDFIDIVAWNRTAEFVCQWFTKGMMAIVVGRIQSRRYQDKNGNNRTAVEVVADEVSFGETKRAREANGFGGNQAYGGGYNNYSAPAPQQQYAAPAQSFDLPSGGSYFAELADDDSDVPF